MSKKYYINSGRACLLPVLTAIIGLSFLVCSVSVYAQAPKILIDLNTASEKELESIKGVGPATAKKIIANRPYKSMDDLKNAGISQKMIESLKTYAKAGVDTTPGKTAAKVKSGTTQDTGKPATEVKTQPPPAKTTVKTAQKTETKSPSKLAPGQKININTANKEQLDALPGIGPSKAQAIIDGRPYKTIEDIMKVKGIKEGTFNKIKDTITVQ